MIATTILLGRAVQPVEQLVGSWRMLTEGRAAYRRLLELSAAFERGEPRLALPKPQGRVAVESLLYRAAGSENADPLGRRASAWRRARRSPSSARAPPASRRSRAC